MSASRSCAILVPASSNVELVCDRALREMERRGYTVVRGRGSSQIDYLRSQMATDFLREGFEETLWIDSDIGFSPEDVEKIRSHNLPITCGLYARKGALALAAKCLPGTGSISFGLAGGLLEIQYAGTGFLHIRRDVYETVQAKLNLPTCNVSAGRTIVPYFLPLIADIDGVPFYLSEDYSFCERARQCGYKIMADTSIRLWHIGTYQYGWEDALEPRPRHDAFVYPLRKS